MPRSTRDAQEPDAGPSTDPDAAVEEVVTDLLGELGHDPDASPSERSRPSRKANRDDDDDDSPDDDADLDDDALDDPDDDEADIDDESDEDEDDDEADEFDEEDDSDYAELRRERDELVAQRDRDRIAAERAEAERTANDRARAYQVREREGYDYFERRGQALDDLEERIIADAQRSVNPQQYLQNGLRRVRTDRKALAAERERWFTEFEAGKNAPRNEQMLDLAIRAMVAEAQVEHGLSHAEAAQLRTFAKKYPDPELVGAEFDRILESRELSKKLAKSSARKVRKRAAREIADKTPRPGQGRRSSSRPARTVDEELDRVLSVAPF